VTPAETSDRPVPEAATETPLPAAKWIPAMAAAWLVPGLGHALLGRVRRGLFFAVIVVGSFALGMAHDGRLALADHHQRILSSLQVLANVGAGPVDLVARMVVYGEPAYRLPTDPSDPAYERRLRIFRERNRSAASIYGTAYLWTAGLMNFLLLFDVWDIARGRKH
jgi:hypothetical protein